MASMLPPLMMTVWFARAGAPVPSITRTLVSATTGASTLMNVRTASLNCGCAVANAAAASASANVAEIRRVIVFLINDYQ
jgi:hypothetical protein